MHLGQIVKQEFRTDCCRMMAGHAEKETTSPQLHSLQAAADIYWQQAVTIKQ